VNLRKEHGSAGGEGGKDGLFAGGELFEGGDARREKGGDAVGEVKGDAAVAFPDGIHAAPHDFSGGDEGIEVGGGIASETSGEDLGFEERRGEGRALEGFDGVEQGVETAAFLKNALPVGFEAGEEARVGGLDFFT
jgi:hypothetical protein